MKDSGIFYRSFINAVRLLDRETQLDVYNAYFDYVLDDIEYSGDDVRISLILELVKPSLEKAKNRYDAAVENGKKGGRPKTRIKPEQNQNKTRTKPESNLNVDEDVDEDVDVASNVEGDVNVSGFGAKAPEKKKRSRTWGKYGRVILNDEQYQRLIDDHGQIATDAAIDRVDRYCQETGKSYNDYELTIRRWGFKEEPEEGQKDKWADDPGVAIRQQYFADVMKKFYGDENDAGEQ